MTDMLWIQHLDDLGLLVVYTLCILQQQVASLIGPEGDRLLFVVVKLQERYSDKLIIACMRERAGCLTLQLCDARQSATADHPTPSAAS